MSISIAKSIKIGLLASLITLSGCGGGSDSSSTSTSDPSATARPIATNNLRIYQSGDSIQYDVTANISIGGVIQDTFIGTISYTVTLQAGPVDPAGVLHSIFSSSTNLTASNGAPSTNVTTTYFEQDAVGNMNFYGDSTDGWITTPASGFYTGSKSPLTSPDSWAGSFITQNGTATNYSTTVVNKEFVATGSGSFETFKVIDNLSSTDANGITSSLTSTQYVVPSIGAVKVIEAESKNTTNGLQTITVTAIMSTTNIPF
ncbi:MAG: hypothetical protein Q9M19_00295 [Mariprofundaceae bacterium]|nr:hypothetical protein [Mariprofundaceae bacterium]